MANEEKPPPPGMVAIDLDMKQTAAFLFGYRCAMVIFANQSHPHFYQNETDALESAAAALHSKKWDHPLFAWDAMAATKKIIAQFVGQERN